MTGRLTRLLGLAALVAAGATAWLGLVATPPDVVQGQLVRLIYVHPAAATLSFLAFGVTALASLLWLVPRTRHQRWDCLAAASAEIGVVLCAIALATGSIWGRPTWGVWWTWDARLTLTALLLAMFLGYLALRRLPADGGRRSTVSAVAGVLSAGVVPVDHYATEWFRTLHQGDTLFRPHPLIHGSQLWTMLLGFLAMTLVYGWLLVHRYRLEVLRQGAESKGLEAALAARRADGAVRAPDRTADLLAGGGVRA